MHDLHGACENSGVDHYLCTNRKPLADVTSAQDGLPPFVIPVNAQCSDKNSVRL